MPSIDTSAIIFAAPPVPAELVELSHAQPCCPEAARNPPPETSTCIARDISHVPIPTMPIGQCGSLRHLLVVCSKQKVAMGGMIQAEAQQGLCGSGRVGSTLSKSEFSGSSNAIQTVIYSDDSRLTLDAMGRQAVM
ncbi:hypothetical protein CCHR01_15230 [Colletotrichum chrysophilum]|uniref:Uncharacterized protein n=1 Tax=Colletotrichum chrysophilum TaxID=1836956 RepID=A0AAD9A627_9PEZI|nr:hypothetical protein CCHR01_15230 [Colletotrichum chrysophilum]